MHKNENQRNIVKNSSKNVNLRDLSQEVRMKKCKFTWTVRLVLTYLCTLPHHKTKIRSGIYIRQNIKLPCYIKI